MDGRDSDDCVCLSIFCERDDRSSVSSGDALLLFDDASFCVSVMEVWMQTKSCQAWHCWFPWCLQLLSVVVMDGVKILQLCRVNIVNVLLTTFFLRLLDVPLLCLLFFDSTFAGG